MRVRRHGKDSATLWEADLAPLFGGDGQRLSIVGVGDDREAVYVLVHFEGDQHTLVALVREDGAVRWVLPFERRAPSDRSVSIRVIKGHLWVVGHDFLQIVDPREAKKLWGWSFRSPIRAVWGKKRPDLLVTHEGSTMLFDAMMAPPRPTVIRGRVELPPNAARGIGTVLVTAEGRARRELATDGTFAFHTYTYGRVRLRARRPPSGGDELGELKTEMVLNLLPAEDHGAFILRLAPEPVPTGPAAP